MREPFHVSTIIDQGKLTRYRFYRGGDCYEYRKDDCEDMHPVMRETALDAALGALDGMCAAYGAAMKPEPGLAQRLAMQGLQSQVDDLRRQLAAACIDRDEAACGLAQRVKEAGDLNRTISARDEQIKHLNDRVRATVEERNRSVMYQGDCAASARRELADARDKAEVLSMQLTETKEALALARQSEARVRSELLRADQELVEIRFHRDLEPRIKQLTVERDDLIARLSAAVSAARPRRWCPRPRA